MDDTEGLHNYSTTVQPAVSERGSASLPERTCGGASHVPDVAAPARPPPPHPPRGKPGMGRRPGTQLSLSRLIQWARGAVDRAPDGAAAGASSGGPNE